MKKIVISSNSTWNLYNFRFDLIREISKKHDVYILAPKDKYVKKFKFARCKNLNLDPKSLSIFQNINYFFLYMRLLKKINPDYFISFTAKPNIFGSLACILLKIKFIPNVTGLGTLFLRGKIVLFFSRAILKFLFKFAHRIYFHNIEDQYLFCNNNIFIKKKSHVIPGSGVCIKKFSYTPLKKKKINIFLYFGRVIKDKGICEFLDAINIIKKKKIPAKFVIVGKIYDNKIKNQIKDLDNLGYLKYFSFTDNIRKFIINASCVILPSYREGLPKSILEAQSIGRPALVSNVQGCRSVINEDYNGFLFKVKSVKDMVRCIIKFIRLPYQQKKKMSINSHLNSKLKFDNKIVINRYLKDLI